MANATKLVNFPAPTKTRRNPRHMTRGDMINAYFDAKEKQAEAQREAEYWRLQLMNGNSVGRHKGFIIYRVGAIKVRGYTRRAYVALRASAVK